ncbi:YqjD family protein [Kingella sp. (in: b-proteobacteria)]|uniref:DUF883 family protein n=1 Tax=Kingella sp. (in: b-proteobacteria) TaxID=2020713 RepID=UPI0026DC0A8B|nr:DUF883 family protein [Kingella sp. (in: b-proteobacteria)]MDO4656237.1 DUF883 domain-containing protein [Kingella sp. (in: b-proteobacteria)]
MKSDFEAQKQALLGEIRTVLNEVENLYQSGVERSTEETQALKTRLQARLGTAQEKLQHLETRAVEQVKHHAQRADEYINEKPYYAMGFAALAGLVVGVLLNRK